MLFHNSCDKDSIDVGFLFVDESGDNGFSEGSTDTFTLAGLAIECSTWKEYLWKIKDVRREITQKYGLLFNEIKGAEIFSHRGPLFNSRITSPSDVQWVYEQFINIICDPMTALFAISLSKEQFREGQNQSNHKQLIKLFSQKVWNDYLAMYNEHLLEKSRYTGNVETGIVYSDMNHSQGKYIRRIVKQYSESFTPDTPFSGSGIIEDVVFRDSATSKFIQLSDILVYSVRKVMTGQQAGDFIVISDEVRSQLTAKVRKAAGSL